MYQDEKIALAVVNLKGNLEVQSTQTTSGYRFRFFRAIHNAPPKPDAFKIEKNTA